MAKELPGICGAHAIITETCRRRGDPVCVEEALERVRRELERSLKAYGPESGCRFHIAFTLERPPPALGAEP